MKVYLPNASGWFDFLEVIDFSLTIDSTPLDSSDSTGEVGSFTYTVVLPERVLSEENLLDIHLSLVDPDKLVGQDGIIHSAGKVTSVDHMDNATATVSGVMLLHALNVRNVTMPPFYGTLGNLIFLYLRKRLVGTGLYVIVDPSIHNRLVTVPGWKGELWLHIKMLCAAESIELVYDADGLVEVRPVRHIEGKALTATNISRSANSDDLAQYVAVKEYNNVWVDNKLFYPPGGWDEDVEIISLNAGETVEFDLELEGSVESIIQPTMVTNVKRDHVSSSVYSVVGDDGFPIQPQMWTDYGGRVSVEIGEDTQHLVLTVTAPEGLPKDDGEEIQSFALAMASGDTDPRYSSLRIVGTGVWFSNDEPVKFPTGVRSRDWENFELGEEIGVTIDNPFLSTRKHVATAVYRAAKKYIGYNSTISGSLQRLSDANTFMEDAGARVFYGTRPYRTRTTTYTPDGIQFMAEDDLTVGDMQNALDGMTVGEVQAHFQGLSNKQVLIEGYRW